MNKIRKGDKVGVISGKYRGKEAVVTSPSTAPPGTGISCRCGCCCVTDLRSDLDQL